MTQPRRIIGLLGQKQSGKDSVGNVLVEEYGFVKISFADAVREFCEKLDPWLLNNDMSAPEGVNELSYWLKYYDGWDRAKEQVPSVRGLLRGVGEGLKPILGDDVWARALQRKILKHPLGTKIVVPDVRFTPEYHMLKSQGGRFWRINRPSLPAPDNHVSEREWMSLKPDRAIQNRSDLVGLRLHVQDLYRVETDRFVAKFGT